MKKICVKDVRDNSIKEFDCNDNLENYYEDHESPDNLVNVNVFYCDGGGWNGKYSVYAFGKLDSIFLNVIPFDITNNEAEYKGMRKALELCDKYDHVRTDSKLIVNQLWGGWKCNYPHLRALRDKCRKIIDEKNVSGEWIPREKNYAGFVIDRMKKVNL